MTEPLFTGVGVALVTLFDGSGAVDAAATAALAVRLVDSGVEGVVVAGSTGEAAALTSDERAVLTRAVRDALPARVPVITGTGAPWVGQATDHTRAAVAAGADGVLVLPPPGSLDLVSYYDAVVGVADGIPVLGYHFARMSAPGLTVAELASLPLDGVKDSSGEAVRFLEEVEVLAPARAVYTGSSALLVLAGAIGATGAILGIANAEPELSVKAFAGDGEAQLALARVERRSRRAFPSSLKELVGERFGTSTAARL